MILQGIVLLLVGGYVALSALRLAEKKNGEECATEHNNKMRRMTSKNTTMN